MFRNEKHATTGPLARLRPQGEACAFLFDRRPRFIDALPVLAGLVLLSEHQIPKSLRRNIATRQNADDLLPTQALPKLDRGGEGRGARAFGDLFGITRENPNRFINLFVADENEIGEQFPKN